MTDVVRPAPEVYRLSMAKLPRAVGRAQRWAALRLVVGATLVTAAITIGVESLHDAIDGALAVDSLALVALPYVMWRAGRRERRHWNAFELSVGAETVRLSAKGAGRVVLRRDEIASLAEGGRGLVVRGSRSDVVIRVPMTVEGYADVRARLAAGRPIACRPDAVSWGAGLLGAGLAAGVLVHLTRSAVMLGLGLVACAGTLAVVGAVEVFSNPLLPRGAKAAVLAAAVVAAALPIFAFIL
jgi:hypothetical protein